MAYQLGVDLGTTYTAAAIHRVGKVEVVTLGNRAAAVPSVIFLKDDESILTGDAAGRRGLSEPDRLARDFKRRMGDPTPILLANTPYSAEALMGKLLRWTLETVRELEGESPERVAVAHPANWGPYKKDLLDQAIRLADLEAATTLTEPEAAAIYYASNERVESGSVIAVYDLGGGTFDAAVLRKTSDGWEILGSPEGIDRLGGIDFDEAVFSHVRRSLSEEFAALDPDDPLVIDAVGRIRRDSVEAKEALSSDTDVSIPVLLPDISTQVRLTRAEFEAMIRPTLQETIGAMQRALRSAKVEASDVSAVLLVGGSSRIPLVAQLVSAELGRPVAVDAHPKHAIALGTALAAASGGASAVPAGVVDVEAGAEVERPAEGSPVAGVPAAPGAHDSVESSPSPRAAGVPVQEVAEGDQAPAPARVAGSPPVTSPDEERQAVGSERDAPAAQESPRRRVPLGLVVGGLVLAAAVIGLVVALGGSGGDGDPAAVEAAAALAVDTTQPTAEGDNETAATPQEPVTTQTTANTTETTEAPDSGEDALSEAEPEPAGPAARIGAITIEDERYVIEYESFDFTPQIDNPGAFHVHFFWDTLPVINAGANGPDPGEWLLWDIPFTVSSPFFDVAAAPEGARKICVVVADNAHGVADVDNDGSADTDTGNCVDLPGG